MTPDEIRKVKDDKYRQRQACTKDTINLGKIRTIDLASNNDIMMPEPASLREELVI